MKSEMKHPLKKGGMDKLKYLIFSVISNMTSHAETRDRVLRLVGKRVKLAATFAVFALYNSTNIK